MVIQESPSRWYAQNAPIMICSYLEMRLRHKRDEALFVRETRNASETGIGGSVWKYIAGTSGDSGSERR